MMLIATARMLRTKAHPGLLGLLALFFVALSPASVPATAEETKKPAPPGPEAALPPDAQTQHVLHLPGRELAYTAVAGSLPIAGEKGEKEGDIAYVAYLADVRNPGERPVTFLFNGGPGAASAYLNLGAIGPEVLALDPEKQFAATPPSLSPNPESWLDFTDLVFVDPVGTGYSRAAPGVDAGKVFWGVHQDIRSLAAFIRLYLTRNDRLASPKYLVGESYGGFRAARLAHALLTDPGIAVSGIFLLSPALDFGLIRGGESNILRPALRLPSYAAAAGATPQILAEAERFALGDYLTALATGPSGKEADRIYAAVARYTGLAEETVRRFRGRIPPDVFIKEIGQGRGTVGSLYDATVAMTDPDPAGTAHHGPDAVLDGTVAPLATAMVRYLRQTLGYRTDLRYELLNRAVNHHWDWQDGGGDQPSVLEDLRQAVALDPQLRIRIAQGLTDLVTPYLCARFIIAHLPTVQAVSPIELDLYPGGHMMYWRPDMRARLKENAAKLYR